MKASDLNWNEQVHRNLRPREYPGDVLTFMDSQIILAQSDIRKVGYPIYPSPVERAHVRHRARRPGGGDCHATDLGKRLVTATDFFCRWEHAPAIWAAIQAHPLIRGAGIYDAMRFRGPAGTYCMVHIDLREVPLNWVGYGRDPVEYIYEPNEPDRYSRLVRNLLENQS